MKEKNLKEKVVETENIEVVGEVDSKIAIETENSPTNYTANEVVDVIKNSASDETTNITDESSNDNNTQDKEVEIVVEELVEEDKLNKKKPVKKSKTKKKKTEKAKKSDEKSIVKKILNIFLSCIAWLVCLSLLYVCFSNVYQKAFNDSGYTGFFNVGQAIVASDSMVPTMTKNDLIFYSGVQDETELSKGDIVVYKTTQNGNDILIVHRIVELSEDRVLTRGDANAQADKPIEKSQVVGKYLFRVPMVGLLLNILHASYAPILFVTLVALIFLIRMIVYLSKRKKFINCISKSKATREAIDHFFDI